MQRIKPHKAIRTIIPNTRLICTRSLTRLHGTCNIRCLGAIQIIRRVRPDIRHKRIDIEIRDAGLRVRLRDEGFVRGAVGVDFVEGDDALPHAVTNLGDVIALVWVKLCVIEAAILWDRVLGGELQRGEVHEDKVAGAALVERGNGLVDAVGVVF